MCYSLVPRSHSWGEVFRAAQPGNEAIGMRICVLLLWREQSMHVQHTYWNSVLLVKCI